MKKVLIIIGKLSVGGAEKIARDIGFYADKTKYEIHYLVYGAEIEAYEEQLLDCGCIIFHFDWPSANYLQYYKRLKELICNEQYDVIHAHTMFNSGWAMLAGKRCKVPVRIAHSHSICNKSSRSIVQSIYERLMRKLICRYATAFVACGNNAGEWLYGKQCFAQKGILLLNGINTDLFSFSEENRHKIREKLNWRDSFIIGHVGHLETVKNQAFLIELMPEILKRNRNAKLLLLGEGKDREMLTSKIEKLGLQANALLAGNVSNVADYLSAMDVLAFPSLYEGTPLALIEAQTNGLPCIVSDQIPRDVFLTDIIQALPLQNAFSVWIDAILTSQHVKTNEYATQIKTHGVDSKTMLQKIYQLYGE